MEGEPRASFAPVSLQLAPACSSLNALAAARDALACETRSALCSVAAIGASSQSLSLAPVCPSPSLGRTFLARLQISTSTRCQRAIRLPLTCFRPRRRLASIFRSSIGLSSPSRLAPSPSTTDEAVEGCEGCVLLFLTPLSLNPARTAHHERPCCSRAHPRREARRCLLQ